MIIKIGSIGTSQTQRTNNKKRKTVSDTSAAQFSGLLNSVDESGKTAPKAPLQETSSLSNVHSMLSLQEVSDEEIATKKALKHGHITLDALEEIRNGLLMGTLSESNIEGLDRIVQQQRQLVTDPHLNAILDEIELRAAVEMAKLEKWKDKL